jgi:surface protein
MFEAASAFNQPLDNWDVSSVTDMRAMFYNASAFNQPLDSWNVSSVTNMSLMFSGALSTANYDALLNAWSAQSLQRNVTFDAEGSTYSPASQAARQSIIDNFNWTINDGGLSGAE